MAKKTTTPPVAKPTDRDAKKAALDAAMNAVKKQYGQGAIMMMDDESVQNIDALSTGSLTLDIALGIGGLPKGRIIEIYGPEGAGKSTLALHCVAEAQKAGGFAAYIDVEHAMDAEYARNIGVKIEETIISQPESGEQALAIAETIIRSGATDIVVIDSVAALVPQQEIDGEMSDLQVGAQARLMSKAMRKLTAAIGDTGTVCVFINQLREKVGTMYGNPETQPGGRALKFYSSVRLDIRRAEPIKEGNTIIGNKVKVKVVKNKVAPPFKEALFDIVFGKGVDRTGEILDIATNLDIIQRSGAFYYYNDVRIGQGRDNAKTYLTQNLDIFKEIDEQVREELLKNKPIVANDDDMLDGGLDDFE